MIEITELMERYRDASRSIWNQYLFDLPDQENWEFNDNRLQYSSIEKRLFETMVLNQVAPGQSYPVLKDGYHENIEGRILFGPKGSTGLYAFRQKNNWSWQEIHLLPETEIDIRFIDFFDWSAETRKDNRFYRFRVVGCKDKKELLGADYLVDPISLRVFYRHSGDA